MVSVIVPNYNHAPYLQQRIDSILNQTFQDFELILLDDLSTDNSKEILEKYRNHPKISHLIFNKINSGSTFKQWNKGVALAKGEIIWIAESDDSADPEFLNTLVNLLERNPNVGLAYSNSCFIDSANTKLRTYAEEYASWSDRWQQDFINNGADEVVHYLHFATVILNVSSCIFRKSVYEKGGGANEAFTLAGDWLTYVKMLHHADIAYCAKTLNFFRTHAQTVRSSTKQFVYFTEKLKVLQYVFENFQVTGAQKKAQLYAVLEEFVGFRKQLKSDQRKSVLQYMRRNFTNTIDLMLWKYKVSLMLKKL